MRMNGVGSITCRNPSLGNTLTSDFGLLINTTRRGFTTVGKLAVTSRRYRFDFKIFEKTNVDALLAFLINNHGTPVQVILDIVPTCGKTEISTTMLLDDQTFDIVQTGRSYDLSTFWFELVDDIITGGRHTEDGVLRSIEDGTYRLLESDP